MRSRCFAAWGETPGPGGGVDGRMPLTILPYRKSSVLFQLLALAIAWKKETINGQIK